MKMTDIVDNVITKVNEHTTTRDIHLSAPTAYHIYNGSLALASTTPTNGFATAVYTGNASTQSINTGVDMDTQWGNDGSEKYGGLAWCKGRSNANGNILSDTIRGGGKSIYTNTATAELTTPANLTAFNNEGFTVGANGDINTNLATYVSWSFQTTHRTSGTTNHGKAYTCHYNPFTGFTMIKYEGSGISGHEIPQHLGRNLDAYTAKALNTSSEWYFRKVDGNMLLNNAAAFTVATNVVFNDKATSLGFTVAENTAGNTYIMYGWANSYFDDANTLIGNYEIGVYQGTGASGNKIVTRGKPAWIVRKSISAVGEWIINDNMRNTLTMDLYANLSNAESDGANDMVFNSDGFTINATGSNSNSAGVQYLYIMAYDNDTGSGKSKYPKPTDSPVLNLNATVPLAKGIDSKGSRNSIQVLNEAVTGVTLTAGKNYVYRTDSGYGKATIAPSYGRTNPANGGDFYSVVDNKWYTSAGVEITVARNYLDAIVYADTTGNATYVEQLPKTVYVDEIVFGNTAFDINMNSYIQNTLPSKAIIENGTNINGRYIKYADGTMVAVVNKYMGVTSVPFTTGWYYVAGHVTYPCTFVSIDNIITAFQHNNGNRIGGFASYQSNTRTLYNVYVVMSTMLSDVEASLNMTIIGRWK